VQGSGRVLFSLHVVLLKGLRKTTKCLSDSCARRTVWIQSSS